MEDSQLCYERGSSQQSNRRNSSKRVAHGHGSGESRVGTPSAGIKAGAERSWAPSPVSPSRSEHQAISFSDAAVIQRLPKSPPCFLGSETLISLSSSTISDESWLDSCCEKDSRRLSKMKKWERRLKKKPLLKPSSNSLSPAAIVEAPGENDHETGLPGNSLQESSMGACFESNGSDSDEPLKLEEAVVKSFGFPFDKILKCTPVPAVVITNLAKGESFGSASLGFEFPGLALSSLATSSSNCAFNKVSCENLMEFVSCGAVRSHFDDDVSFVNFESKIRCVLWNGVELRLLLYDSCKKRVSEFIMWLGCYVTSLCSVKTEICRTSYERLMLPRMMNGDYAVRSVFQCAFGRCIVVYEFDTPALIVCEQPVPELTLLSDCCVDSLRLLVHQERSLRQNLDSFRVKMFNLMSACYLGSRYFNVSSAFEYSNAFHCLSSVLCDLRYSIELKLLLYDLDKHPACYSQLLILSRVEVPKLVSDCSKPSKLRIVDLPCDNQMVEFSIAACFDLVLQLCNANNKRVLWNGVDFRPLSYDWKIWLSDYASSHELLGYPILGRIMILKCCFLDMKDLKCSKLCLSKTDRKVLDIGEEPCEENLFPTISKFFNMPECISRCFVSRKVVLDLILAVLSSSSVCNFWRIPWRVCLTLSVVANDEGFDDIYTLNPERTCTYILEKRSSEKVRFTYPPYKSEPDLRIGVVLYSEHSVRGSLFVWPAFCDLSISGGIYRLDCYLNDVEFRLLLYEVRKSCICELILWSACSVSVNHCVNPEMYKLGDHTVWNYGIELRLLFYDACKICASELMLRLGYCGRIDVYAACAPSVMSLSFKTEYFLASEFDLSSLPSLLNRISILLFGKGAIPGLFQLSVRSYELKLVTGPECEYIFCSDKVGLTLLLYAEIAFSESTAKGTTSSGIFLTLGLCGRFGGVPEWISVFTSFSLIVWLWWIPWSPNFKEAAVVNNKGFGDTHIHNAGTIRKNVFGSINFYKVRLVHFPYNSKLDLNFSPEPCFEYSGCNNLFVWDDNSDLSNYCGICYPECRLIAIELRLLVYDSNYAVGLSIQCCLVEHGLKLLFVDISVGVGFSIIANRRPFVCCSLLNDLSWTMLVKLLAAFLLCIVSSKADIDIVQHCKFEESICSFGPACVLSLDIGYKVVFAIVRHAVLIVNRSKSFLKLENSLKSGRMMVNHPGQFSGKVNLGQQLVNSWSTPVNGQNSGRKVPLAKALSKSKSLSMKIA